MSAEAVLRRRGVVRRLAADGGTGRRAAPAVVFGATSCCNCALRAGAPPALRVQTDLPEGTVVDVVASARRLRRHALRVFAPPVAIAFAAAAGAAAVFGDAAASDALAVFGLLVGMAVAIAACRRSASAAAVDEAAPALVAAAAPANPRADNRQAI